MARMPIKDAAEFLNVSIDTVRRRLRRGELSGEFADGRWLVDVPEPVVEGADRSPVITQFALKVLNDEIEHLRAQNDRLIAIIDSLVSRDPEKRSLWERFLKPDDLRP